MLSHALEDGGLGGARSRRVLRRMEMGRHPRADRGRRAATARSISRTRRRHRPEPFPDVVGGLHFDAVLDGELLVVRDGEVAPFNDLQQRLNRKGVTQEAARAVSRPRAPLRCAAHRWRGPARSCRFIERRATAGGLACQAASAAHRSVAADRRCAARMSCSGCGRRRAPPASRASC